MPETIKLSYHLKLKAFPRDIIFLNNLLSKWGDTFLHVFNHIERIYFSYRENKLPKTAKCSKCKNEELLKWKHRISSQNICNRCFYRLWSYQTLTKKEYINELQQSFPELAIHKGYYSGCIKYAYQQFKSWISKVKDRDYEIKQLKLKIKSETSPIRQRKMLSTLKNKEKGIKKYEFKKNVLYFGSAGMIQLKKDEYKKNLYWLGISDPMKLRQRIWFQLNLGDKKSYQTKHNKYNLVKKSIEKKEYQKLFGKILRKEKKGKYYYEFMYPKPEISHSLTTRKEIEKLYKKNKSIPLIALSFGVKEPITMIVIKNKKIIEKRKFGNGSLWHWINHERDFRSKVMKDMAKRIKSKHKRMKRRKKFFKARGNKERRYIKYTTHKFTTEFVGYISKKYKEGIIIVRDLKGIKRINYPNMYRIVMDRWNIAMEKTFLEYKEMLANFHIYKVPYKESNNLRCSKCNKEIKENKKQIKILTLKLLRGINQQSYWKQKKNMLRNKIQSLQKYPKTKKIIEYIKLTKTELSHIDKKLNELNGNGNHKWVSCPYCNNQNSFSFNDCKQLCSPLINVRSAKQSS